MRTTQPSLRSSVTVSSPWTKSRLPVRRSISIRESTLGSATSTVNDAASQVGQAVQGISPGVGASGQAGVDVRTDQGNARVGVGGAARSRTDATRPAAELRGNGGIGVGADVRPHLPVVRPLLGN